MKSTPHQLFGELRSLMQKPPSEVLWKHLCVHLDRWPDRAAREQAVPYVDGHLSRWPAEVLVAPPRWVKALMYGKLVPGMVLVRTLTLHGKMLGPQSVKPISRLLRKANIETLDLTNAQMSDDGLVYLAQMPFLAGVKHLVLRHNLLRARGMEALANSPYIKQLESLDLSDNLVDNQALEHLGREGVFPNLHTLSLARCPMNWSIVDVLSSSTLTAQLRTLNLSQCLVSGFGVWEALLTRGVWSSLESLDLSHNPLTTKGMQALTKAYGLSHLQHLNLNGTGLQDDGVSALTRQSEWSLKTLSLSSNQLTSAAIDLLGQWSAASTLESLDISQNGVYVDGVWALAHADALDGLRSLSIAHAGLDESAMAVFAQHCHLPHLTSLDISGCPVVSDGARAMAGASWLDGLHHLTMRYSSCSLDDVLTLVHSDWAPNLRSWDLTENALISQELSHQEVSARATLHLRALTLSRCNMTADAMDTLLSHTYMPDLDLLDLSYNRLSEGGLRLLMRTRQLPALKTLNLDNNGLQDADIYMLSNTRCMPLLKKISLINNRHARQNSVLDQLRDRQVAVVV